MTKILVVEHCGRVSPVFDVARNALVIEYTGSEAVSSAQITLHSEGGTARAREIAELGVQVVVCGAISHPFEDPLLRAGLEVFSFICGEVDEVAAAFFSKRLSAHKFDMPGCRHRHKGFRRHCGSRGRRFRNST